jgi:hypothetical protein
MRRLDVMREGLDIGKIYKLWESLVEEQGMDSPDAVAVAKAYKQALDRGKHGGEVSLPQHLRKQKAAPATQAAVCHTPADLQPLNEVIDKLRSTKVDEVKITELRGVIDRFHLRVSKGIGGPKGRRKQDMLDEILDALSSLPLGNH